MTTGNMNDKIKLLKVLRKDCVNSLLLLAVEVMIGHNLFVFLYRFWAISFQKSKIA